MKTIFTNLSILAILILLVSSTNSYAQRNKYNDKGKFPNGLNLTDDQQEKFDKIKFNFEEKKIELNSELDKNRLRIKKLLNTDNFDESKLIELTEIGSNLRTQLASSRVKMWLDVRNILTNEQKLLWKKHFNHNRFDREMFFNNKLGFRTKQKFHRNERKDRNFK